MGWQRRGSKSYFYYTRRLGKRFRCGYIGGGLARDVAAGLSAQPVPLASCLSARRIL
jgi:hypothetical protein